MFEGLACWGMNSVLPLTGTAQFLSLAAPYVPEDFLNQRWNHRPCRGLRRSLSAAQLWRVHPLAVLTPTHSLNQLECVY